MSHTLMLNLSHMSIQDYTRLYARLDSRRQRKADRYLRQDDRFRCVAAGALLQYAVYQGLGKKDFELDTTSLGKPILKNEPNFHFNLSHSGQWVTLVYDAHPVGIDVEQISWDSGKEKIARRYFTPDEQEYVFGQTWQGRAERFFQIWTAKESYLKYLGTGLQKSLDSFSVLQIDSPVRTSIQPDTGYSMSFWAEGHDFSMEMLTVEQLLW